MGIQTPGICLHLQIIMTQIDIYWRKFKLKEAVMLSLSKRIMTGLRQAQTDKRIHNYFQNLN